MCETYAEAKTVHQQGGHVVSTDEKTSIQALERLHPTLPTRPGLIERVEAEYKRHGTLCLIANFDVVTGKAITPTIGPTRTEEDFVAHIARTVDLDADATWIFVADQLNTHKSEALVHFVAERCGIDDALGRKGKKGILKNMKTRKRFLEAADHRIPPLREIRGAIAPLTANSPNSLRLHPASHVVAEPGRDLVQYPLPPSTETRLVRLAGSP